MNRRPFADVHTYLTSPEIRARVTASAAKAISTCRPDVVIAHSLGAVVAIEALAMDQGESRIGPRALLTLGAPLAWPRFARSWSAPARNWMERPGCRWDNVLDLSDEVTGNRVPPVSPYGQARHVVVNNDHLLNRRPGMGPFGDEGGLGGTHNAVHYLSHPLTTRVLTDTSRS